MTFKKNKIAILIIASLPFSSWAKTADFDESGLNKIIFDGTDTSLLSVGTLYPKDANNKYISENNLVAIDYATDKANTVLKKVFGGLCNGISESCDVTNTNVIINNGFINSDSGVGIHGAYANAKNNAGAQGRIYLNNSAEVIGNIYAAYAQAYDTVKNATANAVGDVYLNDTAKVTGDVQGAYAYVLSNEGSDATLTGNVYLNDNSVVNGNVYGAYSHIQTNSGLYARSETQGSVYLNNNTSVTGNVYGARDFVNTFANNTSGTIAQANISGQIYLNNNASIKGDIYGTYVYAHAYSYNNFDVNATATATSDIFLNDNTAVSGNIYATYFDEFSSLPGSLTAIGQGNVSILGNVKLQDDSSGIVLYNSEIWGGYLKNSVSYYDIFTNNTFSMGANALTIDKMGNFESYKFYLNDYNKHVINDSNVALVTVTGQIKNSSTVLDNNGTTITTTNQSMAKIDGISGKNIVKKGDTIVLINANGAALEKKIETFGGSTSTVSMSDLFANTPANNTVALGLIRKADISYAIDNTNQTITAKIENIRTYADAIKPLAEGRIASLQNTVRGADELINIMGDNKTVGTFTPIAVVNGGINKYNSGSSVDTRDYRIMVGSRYQFLEQLYSGMTLEYGRSNYDTHNNLATGKIDGDGHSANYGFSLFSKYNHDIDVGNVYLDAVLRFGRTSTEFKSNDIILGSGEIAHYKSKVNYIGGSVGTGYIYPFNEKSNFDSSARYFYTRLGSDSMVLDGDKINFKKSTSSRVQLKEQYNYQSSANLTFYLAGIYEYEFDGKANANVSGISIDAPSLQGSTGVMELGIKSVPIADNKNVLFDLSFKGYSGKRDGAAMSAAIEYDF